MRNDRPSRKGDYLFRTRWELGLFSDAKVPKDIPENLICRNLTNDGAEVVDGFADVLGGEVGWEASGESFAYAEEGSAGVCEGLYMTLVCDQGCVAISKEIAL